MSAKWHTIDPTAVAETVTRHVSAGRPDSIVRARQQDDRVERLLSEPDWVTALARWLGPNRRRLARDRQALLQRLDRDIARLDALIGPQLNAILHHPRFQRLEAAWRGLHYLVDQAGGKEGAKVRVLNVRWRELARDLERAIEFDQSQLFRKVYSEQFDMPGGEPFGLLIGDYPIRHRPGPDHPVDDVAVLRGISQVSAAAFAPFVASVHPSLLGLESFTELEMPVDLASVFRQQKLEYLAWQHFRESEDSRFVGLTLPRVLYRLPYQDDAAHPTPFAFAEDVAGPDNRNYLWGSAAFAFAAVVLQSFDNSGWLADIRGVPMDEDGSFLAAGGVVTGLPVPHFATDRPGLVPKYATEISLGDYRERELSDLGLIPLCPCRDTPWSAFHSSPSVQAPEQGFDSADARANARLSAMLNYILCASRFAHHLKIIGREKGGSFIRASELEKLLQQWLLKYTTGRDSASFREKARYPLRESQVRVVEQPGRPGRLACIIHLRPHYQLEQLNASIRLETEITPGEP